MGAATACGSSAADDEGSAPAPSAARTVLGETSSVRVSTTPFDGWTAVEAAAGGDAGRGKALVVKFECSRCHVGTGTDAPPFEKQCVHCHELVATASLPFRRDKAKEWQATTRHYLTAPNLADLGQTIRPSWVASFLRDPMKVRTRQEEWMPRLAISERDARDLAAYLVREAAPMAETSTMGEPGRGARVVARKGCFLCHEFTGAERADVAMESPALAAAELAKGMTQAPDLKYARSRFRPDVLAAWIANPARVRSGARMPNLGLTDQEARDAAAYIATTPLAAAPPETPFARLPMLDRPVHYEEVATRVFRKSCVHCHSDASASGDPGPGSVGGFGFPARKIQLSSERSVFLGYLGDDRRRHSLMEYDPALARWGGARLVAALVARHEETSGRPVREVRGMPMGLPGLSAEDLQLVETWVAQGAPR
jgi:cytochrome c1